jgi:hypothetical protein
MKIDITPRQQELLVKVLTASISAVAQVANQKADDEPFTSLITRGRALGEALELKQLLEIIQPKGDDDATGNTTRKGSAQAGATTRKVTRSRAKGAAAPDRSTH